MTVLDRYFSEFPFAEIRSDDGASSLKICTYSYAYPSADNPHDANWYRNILVCVLPAFKAEIEEVILDGLILSHFLGELHDFITLKKSSVKFEPTEPYFDLELSFNSRKNVIVKGSVQYPAGWGAELRFELDTNLTYVERFYKELESTLKEFPVR